MKSKTKVILATLLVIALILIIIGINVVKNKDKPNINKSESKPVTSEEKKESEYKDVDYSVYFKSLNGCAVIYDVNEDIYYMHNSSAVNDRKSPYSTFKIAGTLMGLHNKVLQDENSTMKYNGSDYGLDSWNKNLSLKEAMESSCVWYFRQVIDQVGETVVEKELKELGYGNSDTSQWKGSGINPSNDLNGFWLDSSLEITPMEQVQVLAKIIKGQSVYSKEEISILKKVMLKDSVGDYTILGKTGTNQNKEGWYVGFANTNEKDYCFAVYISSENSNEIASGKIAREIVKEIFKNNSHL